MALSETDIIKDRLSVTVDKLEVKRSGITERAISEAKTELGYTTTDTDLKKLHVGILASIKLCRSALDLYQEDIAEEQADDVRRQYQERIQFLREKLKQLQAEFESINARLLGDPNTTPPCFKIEKATSEESETS